MEYELLLKKKKLYENNNLPKRKEKNAFNRQEKLNIYNKDMKQ